MTSKKDYIAIVEMISLLNEKNTEKNELKKYSNYTLLILTRMLVSYFHKDNPNFNQEKFISACGF